MSHYLPNAAKATAVISNNTQHGILFQQVVDFLLLKMTRSIKVMIV